MDDQRYAYAEGRITHDVLDGEVLVIEEATGAYFSLSGPAASVWIAIGNGRSLDQIAASVGHHHGVESRTVRDDVESFLQELRSEGLVVITGNEGGPPSFDAVSSGPWSPPTIGKFTDLRDLLLFDPIHEVDTTGWPNLER
jgi:hypothetical protein